MMHEGNDSPVKDRSTTSLNPVVMSGAIGGSKDNSPKTEKEDEEKHKQREKTAYARRPLLMIQSNVQAEIYSPAKSPVSP
jgi:hypothetical protein